MYRIFGHYIPKTIFIFGLFETLMLFVSIYLALLVSLQSVQFSIGNQVSSTGWTVNAVLFICIIQMAMFAMGLYHRDLRDGPKLLILRIILSFVLGLACLKILGPFLSVDLLGTKAQLVAFGCAFTGIMISRLVLFRETDNVLKKQILVMGVGEKAQLLERLRRRTDNPGVEIIGYVNFSGDDTFHVSRNKVINVDSGSLSEYIKKTGVKEIVVAVDDRRKSIPIDELLNCKLLGVNIIDITEYLERQSGQINLDIFYPSAFVFSDGFANKMESAYKRILDIFVSSAILLVTAPVMLIAVTALLFESSGKGSIIYRQKRMGLNGKSFNLLKFRSMHEDAEKDGVAVWASKNDSRVTRVGAFMRKTRIDELPQLINVLKGDMALVGPRPERPEIVKELSEKIPFFDLRHYVKPGVTGWAQICYNYGSSVKDSKQKLQYDLYYLKNYSVFLDLVIIFQTIAVIFWAKGAR
jgi:sugar transferase (PEP-CTERM system associated)